jgi:hypothetical protein
MDGLALRGADGPPLLATCDGFAGILLARYLTGERADAPQRRPQCLCRFGHRPPLRPEPRTQRLEGSDDER